MGINDKKNTYKVQEFEVEESPPWWCSCRLLLAIIGFFGFINIYAQRVGMSVAIVCMVNQTAVRMLRDAGLNESETVNSSAISNEPSCAKEQFNSIFLNGTNITTSGGIKDGPFVWEKELQGHILGAFFYGYLVSQVPAGLLAERFGGKWVFAGFTALSTIGTLLMPIAARIHVSLMIILRVIIGIGSGGTFPAFHTIWSHWAPPMERSKLAGITYAGAMMGNVISLPISGLLCEHGFDGGWASIFYVFGITSVLWLIVWVLLTSNSPAGHARISKVEKDYIMGSLEGQMSEDKNKKKDSVPWRSVLTSGPVWGIIIANFTTDWGLYTYLTNIPTYLSEVLKFEIQQNGFFSALPFIGLWANMNISPIIADKLRSSGVLSTTAVRKIFQCIGAFGSAVFLIGLAFVDCSQAIAAVGLLTLGVTLSGCTYSAFLVNHMDIAPKFAGTLFGLANCLAACSGFIAPYVVAIMTKNQSREEWMWVFFLSAAIYVVGAIVYVILGSGELQEWAKDKPSPESVALNTNPLKNDPDNNRDLNQSV
eukprot:GHVU01206233.1.p1 GENE.GHVU01206233.1~~GHVU01206233.1.p1  ORF type:complete len:538 (+),score=42.06 GHVU01206233.1:259-1872(+)